jgi:hypothetical protein
MLSVGNISAWQPGSRVVDICIGLFGLPRVTTTAAKSIQNLYASQQKQISIFINTWYRKTEIPETWHNLPNLELFNKLERQFEYFSIYGESVRSMTIQLQRDFDPRLQERSNLLNQALSISTVASDIKRFCDLDGVNPSWIILTRQDAVFRKAIPWGSLEAEGNIYLGGHYDQARAGQLNSEDIIMIFSYKYLDMLILYFSWITKNVGKIPYNPLPEYFKASNLEYVILESLEYSKNLFIDRSYAL